MATKPPTFDATRAEYADLWNTIEIRPSKAADIETTAKKVIQFKNGRYGAVEDATTVPWFVVGIIHQLECGGNFAQNLCNGDTLARRTTHVPAGRPAAGAPPFTWKDAAIDAVRYDGLDKVPADAWSIERILFQLEAYNGWGYEMHHPEVKTPYLWSGTNHYSRGKYVEDGQWSSDAVSGQSGAAAILKRAMELDPEIAPKLETASPAASIEEKVDDPSLAFPRASNKPDTPVKNVATSRTIGAMLTTMVALVGHGFQRAFDGVGSFFGDLPDIQSSVDNIVQPTTSMLGMLHIHAAQIETTIGTAALIIALLLYAEKKIGGKI